MSLKIKTIPKIGIFKIGWQYHVANHIYLDFSMMMVNKK